MSDSGYSEAEHLEALRAGVAKTAREHFANRDQLVPIPASAAFVAAGNWTGPFDRLVAPELVLTWATLGPHDTMVYFSHDQAAVYAEEAVDFRTPALENLRRMTLEKWTYEFKRGSGELWGVGLMHADACGPSRLLLRDIRDELFPFGFRIAAPERSCALVI